jgi:hypothetical protein
MNPTINLTIGEDTPFHFHAPKSDGITAVRLTKQNLTKIATHIREELGGSVTIEDTLFVIGELVPSPVDGALVPSQPGSVFEVGDWVVEEYDYTDDVNTYRVARIDERRKYDLR